MFIVLCVVDPWGEEGEGGRGRGRECRRIKKLIQSLKTLYNYPQISLEPLHCPPVKALIPGSEQTVQTLHQTLHLRCWVQGLGAQEAGEELSSSLGVLARVIWGLPKIRGTILRVPIITIIVFGIQIGVPLFTETTILDYIDIIRGGSHRARKRKVHSTFFGCTLRINSARYKGLALAWGLGLTLWSFQ